MVTCACAHTYLQIEEGHYVSVTPEDPSEPVYIARVMSMWEEDGDKMFHAGWLSRGSETVLGEASDPSELFVVDSCGDSPLGAVVGKVTVSLCQPDPENWRMQGGEEEEMEENQDEGNDTDFFVQKYYDSATARFEDIPGDYLKYSARDCCSCARNGVRVSVGSIGSSGYCMLTVDVCVFLLPGATCYWCGRT